MSLLIRHVTSQVVLGKSALPHYQHLTSHTEMETRDRHKEWLLIALIRTPWLLSHLPHNLQDKRNKAVLICNLLTRNQVIVIDSRAENDG